MLRGGYKYGGLALQVGGWATGGQPVTVKKAVRIPKMWPRNWKERSENRADWEKSIKEAKVLIGL
jgi:hypothetical protein